jgi:VanZ family protein
MAKSWRHRTTIILLSLYWLILFIFAHIPMPKYVEKAGVSDKCLHFLAYLVLTFLLWFSVKPDKKIQWRKAAVWWIFIIVTVYGAVDELVQSLVGRTCDVIDIAANISGIITGLLLFTFFTFWPAALFVTGIVIFGVTNLLRVNLAELLPVTNTIFHLLAYAFFTALWLCNTYLNTHEKTNDKKWFAKALAAPMTLLIIVKIFSAIIGRGFTTPDTIASLAGIITVVAAVYLWNLYHKPET